MIYHDFQRLDNNRRLILNLQGTLDDLRAQHVTLEQGLKLTFWSDDTDPRGNPDPLIVEGIVSRNTAINEWVAEIDWDKIRHKSELHDSP